MQIQTSLKHLATKLFLNFLQTGVNKKTGNSQSQGLEWCCCQCRARTRGSRLSLEGTHCSTGNWSPETPVIVSINLHVLESLAVHLSTAQSFCKMPLARNRGEWVSWWPSYLGQLPGHTIDTQDVSLQLLQNNVTWHRRRRDVFCTKIWRAWEVLFKRRLKESGVKEHLHLQVSVKRLGFEMNCLLPFLQPIMDPKEVEGCEASFMKLDVDATMVLHVRYSRFFFFWSNFGPSLSSVYCRFWIRQKWFMIDMWMKWFRFWSNTWGGNQL